MRTLVLLLVLVGVLSTQTGLARAVAAAYAGADRYGVLLAVVVLTAAVSMLARATRVRVVPA
jgi:hypothetical protein